MKSQDFRKYFERRVREAQVLGMRSPPPHDDEFVGRNPASLEVVRPGLAGMNETDLGDGSRGIMSQNKWESVPS